MSNWFSKLFASRSPQHGNVATTAPRAHDTPFDAAEACKNKGNEHLAKGDFDAALDCYRQAIAINPNYADAFNNLGYVHLWQGRYDEAELHLSRAISLNPGLANAHYNRGNLCRRQGRPDDAVNCFRQATALNREYAEAHYSLANVLYEQGKDDDANASVRFALALDPDHFMAHNLLGLLLDREGRLDDASESYRRAASLNPDFFVAHHNLGLVLRKQDQLDQALIALDKATLLNPEFADAHNMKGVVLQELGRLEEASVAIRKALSLNPELGEAYINLGLVLQYQGKLDAAEDAYKSALAIVSEVEQVRYHLALLLLARGNLALGWEYYESRFFSNCTSAKRHFPQPYWTGGDLTGKSLLIWCEQGVGDEILFAGLFPEVIARARRCVIECAPKLLPLFARSFPTALLVPSGNPPHPATQGELDCQIAAGSLARWLRPSLESFPRRHRYLKPSPERVGFWNTRLGELGSGLKVGFCWRSSRVGGVRRQHYTGLDQWGPIFGIPGIHFVSLQYDQCSDELAAAREQFGVTLHEFKEVDLFNDLDESAALTAAMDLVITAATAVSSLAAAQGIPTWEICYGNVWLRHGTDHIPWLPSTRLFTRQGDQDWEEIIASVAEQLTLLARNHS